MEITKKILWVTAISIVINGILLILYFKDHKALIEYHEVYKFTRDAIKECEASGGLFNLGQEQVNKDIFSLDGRCLYMKVRLEMPNGEIQEPKVNLQ